MPRSTRSATASAVGAGPRRFAPGDAVADVATAFVSNDIASVPVRAQEHHLAGFDPAVLGLERLERLDLDRRAPAGLRRQVGLREVDHDSGPAQLLERYLVSRERAGRARTREP